MDSLHQPNSTVLTDFRNEYNADGNRIQHVASHAITHTAISKVLVKSKRADELHAAFSDELDVDTKISDQQQSGRCWIFSFLNVLRAHFVHEYELPSEFEFSQAYLFFWDQFEKSNQFLKYIWELKDEPSDHPVVRELLKDPISDGGQWHMLQNLVSKYGVVPKHCMSESKQANATDKMNTLLSAKLREYAHHLRTRHVSNLEDTLRPMLFDIYSLLCVCLGEPPKTIRWEYTPSSQNFMKRKFKKHYHKRKMAKQQGTHSSKHTSQHAGSKRHSSSNSKHRPSPSKHTVQEVPLHTPTHIDKKPFEESKEFTPLDFYKEFVHVPIDEYVTVINYPHPDRPFHRRFQVKYLNNMVGGRESELHNLPIEDLKQIAIRSIDAGEPVWFCADVGKDCSIRYGILDPDVLDYRTVFSSDPHGWDKGLRMEYKEGIPSHAMALRGYHVPSKPDDTPTKPSHTVQRKRSSRSSNHTRKSKKTRASSQSKKKTQGGHRPQTKSNTESVAMEKTARKQPSRWLVENSWGDFVGKNGNLVMSDAWFDRHVYEIAVHKRHLLKPPDKKPVIKLEMWDVFGSLFTLR